MTSRIAEQDSLEGLIARLRKPDSHDPACPFIKHCYCAEGAPHDNVLVDDKLEAADTLSQMRDALGDALDLIDELYRRYDVELDAEDVAFAQKSRTVFLTTTKIEKPA